MSKYSHVITEAFQDPNIINLTNQAIAKDSSSLPIFEAIATYHLSEKRRWTQTTVVTEPANKKRKLENGAPSAENGAEAIWKDISAPNVVSYPSVSFSVPQRKKLTLQLVPGQTGGVRALNAAGGIEFGMSWSDAEVFCLPVPEKAKPQYNFVAIPRDEGAGLDPVVWTEMETPELDKTKQVLGQMVAQIGKTIIEPDAQEFVSAIPQSHRKGEKGYHVKAFKGSKDGFLFFLPTGILFAFKKPILYFPFHAIVSISYTSVLQRTFNLVIGSQVGDSQEQETEFSMLDQADFAGIDEYIKHHNLNDASLAASRKAQRYGVNDPKNSDKDKDANGTNGDAAANGQIEEESELLKAERMLDDEEDEEDEEDYDPGSEGDSEGSGSESDLDSDDDDDEGDEEDGEEDEEGEDEMETEEVDDEVGHVHAKDELPDEPEGGFL